MATSKTNSNIKRVGLSRGVLPALVSCLKDNAGIGLEKYLPAVICVDNHYSHTVGDVTRQVLHVCDGMFQSEHLEDDPEIIFCASENNDVNKELVEQGEDEGVTVIQVTGITVEHVEATCVVILEFETVQKMYIGGIFHFRNESVFDIKDLVHDNSNEILSQRCIFFKTLT